MAVRTLAANKLRSGLTMLGIIIGNASVIAMVSLGQGAQQYVSQEFESLGTNVLFIVPGVQQRGPQAGAAQSNSLVLADADAIAAEVPAVKAVAPEKSERFQVTRGGQDTQVTITGTAPSYPQVHGVAIAQGRFFTQLDIQANSRVAVLGSETAQTLFGNRSPLNEKIRIRNLSFSVVGVFSERGASFGQNRDEIVIIPIDIMANQLTGVDVNRSSPIVQSIAVSSQQASAAQYQITNLLRLRHNILRGENDFTVRSQQELLQTANNITNILVLVLGATAGISLVVGGIGIMNIMLVSVTERTQEIGLRKAIGAKQNDILIQFTIEAVILSTLGGGIGIVCGVGGTLAIAALSPLGAVISPVAIGIAVGVSGAIGLVFGVVPARRAARLNPIVALRST